MPEILIVVAVIGILAGIVAVAWSTVATSSRNKARDVDVKQWSSTLDLYKSRFLAWPVIPSSDTDIVRLCLGQSEFVAKAGGYCGQYTNATKRLAASNSTTFLAETKKTGGEPKNGGPSARNVAMGPFIYMTRATAGGNATIDTWIVNYFEGSSCPSGLTNTLPTNTNMTALTGGLPSGIIACGLQKTLVIQP